MKIIAVILLTLLSLKSLGEDSTDLVKKQVFIDVLQPGATFKIECAYSACFHHTSYTISIVKKQEVYHAEVRIIDSYKGGKKKHFYKKAILNPGQIDNVRNFEHCLDIYPSADSDGQVYYNYKLVLNKKEKVYFDGVQGSDWMKIEGLKKILFPD